MKSGAQNYRITNPRDMPGFVKEWSKGPFTAITGVNTLFNGLLNTPGFEGDGVPDRQGRGEAGGRLYARRDRERHHRRHPGLVRADDRLRRHQDSALRVREVQRRRAAALDRDEIGDRKSTRLNSSH